MVVAEACVDCVDLDADENLIDDSLVAVEMHPTSEDEAETVSEEGEQPLPSSPSGDADSDGLPAADGLRGDTLGFGTPPLPSLPLPAVSLLGRHPPRVEPLRPPPAVVSGSVAAPLATVTLVWLRMRRGTSSLDDDLLALR